ncbi:MAG: hypothetical protein GF349_02760 [Candidatus Magasanikbacteria bacterium]|nr:hypothetical protein [Candidatus Magasanikbacteria bacterium]
MQQRLRDLLKIVQVKTQISEFKVWKTIKLGTGPQTVADLRWALEQHRINIDKLAGDMLGHHAFTMTGTEFEVDLVVVSVSELGFIARVTRTQIYERTRELGLELCPADVGPLLRLQYKDQPVNEIIRMGMEAIIGPNHWLYVFELSCDEGGLWLGGEYGIPDRYYNGDDRWVFVLPRKG